MEIHFPYPRLKKWYTLDSFGTNPLASEPLCVQTPAGLLLLHTNLVILGRIGGRPLVRQE